MNSIRAKVVVFDQGNTLLMDPFPKVMELKKEDFGNLFRGHGINYSAQKIIDSWADSNKKIHYPYIGHFFQEEPIVQDALRSLEIQSDVASILTLDLLKVYRMGLKQYIKSDPRTKEVRRTIQQLKSRKKRLGVFSDDRIVALDIVLEYMDISQEFEYIYTSEKIGIEKPDPGVFEHILNYFKVQPQEVIYVGDDPVRDIYPSKKKGFKAILYDVDKKKYSSTWKDYDAEIEYQPDATVTAFSQLIDVII
jgi:HAD superfamily hydrolase (TIGR01549 family)